MSTAPFVEPVPVVARRLAYLEELWFLVHHSDDPNRKMILLTCYGDDSGIDDLSPVVVLGGLLMGKNGIMRFDETWRTMLYQFRLDRIHMNDFVRPNGKHCGMPVEMKLALFTEVARTINKREEYSFSIQVGHQIWKDSIPNTLVAPYAAAFVYLAQFNAAASNDNGGYPDQIAYLLDHSAIEDQILLGHNLVQAHERLTKQPIRTAALAFDHDDNVTGLQAADVVAWASRRKYSGNGLGGDYMPLEEVFVERFDKLGIPLRPHFNRVVNEHTASKFMDSVRADGDSLQDRDGPTLESRSSHRRRKRRHVGADLRTTR